MSHNRMPKDVTLISNSRVQGGPLLSHVKDHLKEVLGTRTEVLFVPWAYKGIMDPKRYEEKISPVFSEMGYRVVNIAYEANPVDAVRNAQAIFVGGGNTFVLLRALYTSGIMPEIQQRVAEGMPYIGSSAGSNVAGVTIANTNDNPIVWPPSTKALGLVYFNIKPHFLDTNPPGYMGETHADRVSEFHALEENDVPVIGMREGAWLRVQGNKGVILGTNGARLFRKNMEAVELVSGDSIDSLLQ